MNNQLEKQKELENKIQELIQAQEQLKKLTYASQERYELIIDALEEGIWDWNVTTNEIYFSEKWKKQIGYEDDELKNDFNTWVELLHPDEREYCLNAVDNYLNNPVGQFVLEFRMRHKDGTYRWIRNKSASLKDKQGKVIRFLGSHLDITEQLQNDYKNQLNSRRLKALVDILQYSSDSFQDYLDYALTFIIEITESKIGYIYYYDEDAKLFELNTWSKEVMNECRIVEKRTTYELDKTGIWGEAVRQRRPIMVNDFQAFHPLKKGYPEGHAPLYRYLTIPVFSNNKIVGVVAVANKNTDYTDEDTSQLTILMDIVWKVLEKKKSEYALEKSEQRYRDLLNNLEAGIIVHAPDTSILMINPRAAKLLGLNSEEIPGKKAEDSSWHFIYEDHTRVTLETYPVNRIISTKKTIKNQIIGIHHNQSNKVTWVEVTGFPLLDATENITEIVISLINITDRKKVEEALRESEEKFREMANMSHEIRTPMNGILGFAELLKEPELSGEQQQEYIKIIEKSGARMLNIINDIIDISKIESGLMKTVMSETNINEAIEYICTFFQPETAAKGIQLSCHRPLSDKEATLLTDTEKVYAILTNLVKNAIKYTNYGSIELGYVNPGKYLVFFVRDTGIGIAPNRQAAIFERFIQADISDKMAYGLSGDRKKAVEAGCTNYLSKPISKDELHGLIIKNFTT